MSEVNRKEGVKSFLKALEEIELYYGDKRAKRSGVRLMNHINEGYAIISTVTMPCALEHVEDMLFYNMAAFCLHPLFQSDDVDVTVYPFKHTHDDKVVKLVKDYAEIANMYLCREDTDHIQSGEDLREHLGDTFLKKPNFYSLVVMLYADKVQNRKDFQIYHRGSHKRSKQLERYFDIWVEYLENWVK